MPRRCETAEARAQAAQSQLEEVLAKNGQQELQAAQAEIDSLRQNLVAATQEAESFRWAYYIPLLALCRQKAALAGQLPSAATSPQSVLLHLAPCNLLPAHRSTSEAVAEAKDEELSRVLGANAALRSQVEALKSTQVRLGSITYD